MYIHIESPNKEKAEAEMLRAYRAKEAAKTKANAAYSEHHHLLVNDAEKVDLDHAAAELAYAENDIPEAVEHFNAAAVKYAIAVAKLIDSH